jgi:AmpE protein
MKFLALLGALFFSRLLFRPHSQPYQPAAASSRDRVIVWLFLSLCLEALLLFSLEFAYGVPVLLLETALLSYWLGRSTPGNLLQEYADLWARGHYSAASAHAAEQIRFHEHAGPERPLRLHYRICQRYLQQLLLTLFVPLFWFWLAGIPGLLLAVLVQPQLETLRPASLAYWVQWLPVRLLGFSFFIVGSGNGAWFALSRLSHRRNDIQWLFRVGLGAIGDYAGSRDLAGNLAQRGSEEMDALQRLVARALVLWLLIIAALAMAGFEIRLY